MWKNSIKNKGSKEQYWEIDYLSLQEEMGENDMTSWLLSKMSEDWCNEIKDRIQKVLTDWGNLYSNY